ncbi:signal peptidase complex catalytic subunit SEC11A-like protein [Tanacetum coccineum]
MGWIGDQIDSVKSMHFRQLFTQAISLGMIVTSALIIWKGLMCVTGSESPVVVVLSGSMEPGFKRGDILFLHMSKDPIRAGEIVVFNVDGREIPIVHRVHEHENGEVDVLTKGDNNFGDDRLLYAQGQMWLQRHHIMGRAVGFLPYVGWVTIIMTEQPIIKNMQKEIATSCSPAEWMYVLDTHIPEDGGEDDNMEQIRKRIWDSLEAKYMAEDASSKKFLVSNFTTYKMTDLRPFMEQYNELLDFKHTLKHLKEELTLVELGSHLRIEESLRVQDSDKPKGNNVVGPQLNIVNDNIGSAFMSISKLNDSILWHARLGHVHFKRMQDMSKDGLIPAFDMDTEKVPNKRNKITPYELWTKRKPNLKYLRVWDCRAVVRLLDPKLKTLGEKGIECIFAGYAEHSKAFRFYVIEPNESVSVNSIIESRGCLHEVNIYIDSIDRGCVSLFTLEMQVTLQNEIKQKISLYKGGVYIING